MCGDIDEASQIDEKIFARFLALAQTHGVRPPDEPVLLPGGLGDTTARHAYMERLFRSGLARCVSDAAGLPEGQRVNAIAGQAIVFARLAGLLAGQLPPEADLFRTAIEAFMDGHAETGGAEAGEHRH